jgi:nucleotide-binding universal stress UspA family protein
MASLLGASMLLVRVIPRLPVSAENGQTVGDEMMSRLNESLARQADLLRAEYDTQFESLATVGSPAKVLVDLADTDPETVLLVVGNRGLGRIAQFRLGSVSHDVLHAAHSPVLIVPSREAYPNGRVLQQTFCHSTILA